MLQILDPRCEPIAQQMAEAEHVVCGSGGTAPGSMPYLALTEPPAPARPPAWKYWPSEDDVVPSSQIAAIGCLWCALTMAAWAAT